MNDIQMIPLGKLRLSEANVRKNDSNLFIEELAANIEAKGLLQNLIVVPAKRRGFFDVTAGGRRLRALNALFEAGKVAKTHEVPCKVIDTDSAEQSELSLIENVIRLDMTPTERVEALAISGVPGGDSTNVLLEARADLFTPGSKRRTAHELAESAFRGEQGSSGHAEVIKVLAGERERLEAERAATING